MPNLDPGFTPMQGRVLFHIERIFRSARLYGMPYDVTAYTDADCRNALTLIENAARDHGMHRTRNITCS